MTSNPDWQAIRSEYESGLSLRQLASKYNVSKTYIIEKRNKEQWNRPTDHRPLLSTQSSQPLDVNSTTRLSLALSLRRQRYSYEEIAKQCGYADKSGAWRAIQGALRKRVVIDTDMLRAEESEILDEMHQKIWPFVVDPGSVDLKKKPDLWAVDRLMALSLARRQLFNLDVKPDDTLEGVTVVRSYGVEVDKV